MSDSPSQLDPTADANELIEQIAKPYKEVPWAVIRELFQNATDSIKSNSDGDAQFIEFALLTDNTTPSPSTFHIVIRDSGTGMTDSDIAQFLTKLGAGTKKTAANLIGQFGVGFFATHAICTSVRVLTRSIETKETIAWDYAPNLKKFFRVDPEEMETLLKTDFENHPVNSRCREYGTSIYLNLNIEDHPHLIEWLTAEALIPPIRRDFYILPYPIFLADYTKGYPTRVIKDSAGTIVTEDPLNLSQGPWECKGPAREESVRTLINFRKSTKEEGNDDIPDWAIVTETIGDAVVNGLVWLDMERTRQPSVDLLLKRMWVESAQDVHPAIATLTSGLFDITPSRTDLDIDISPQRDHILRDGAFRKARTLMQSGLIGLFEKSGRTTVDNLQELILRQPDTPSKIQTAIEFTEQSSYCNTLSPLKMRYGNLLSDIPKSLTLLFTGSPPFTELTEHVVTFVNSRMSPSITPNEITGGLQALQKNADEEHRREDLAVDRQPLHWNPSMSRKFLKTVGIFLPVPLSLRERRSDGGFNVKRLMVPLKAVPTFVPAASSELQVLLKGSVSDYFSKETTVAGIIDPAIIPNVRDQQIFTLTLALVSRLSSDTPPLKFIEHKRDLLKTIVNPDAWIPLIECFRSIVNSNDERPGQSPLNVEAMGFKGDESIPLLYEKQDPQTRIIINAYNPLIQKLLQSYVASGQRNDDESRKLIAQICHELYHHAILLDHEPASVDRHAVVTRNSLFDSTIQILQKYADARQ